MLLLSGLPPGEPLPSPPKLLLLKALAVTAEPTCRFRALVGVRGVGGEEDAREEERNGEALGPIEVDFAGETNRLTRGEA